MIWNKTQYLEGPFDLYMNTQIDKQQWMQEYEKYFDVPDWLA